MRSCTHDNGRNGPDVGTGEATRRVNESVLEDYSWTEWGYTFERERERENESVC